MPTEPTAEQYETERKQWFEENRKVLDAQFNSLPPVFQRRIELRRERNPDFRWEHERYEMFCCTQAVAFAERAMVETDGDPQSAVEWLSGWSMLNTKHTPEGVSEDWAGWAPFNQQRGDGDWETQKRLMPALSDRHSVNTFDIAITLAFLFLRSPELVPLMYGAASSVVGSENYGDPIDLMEEKREELDDGTEDQAG